MAEELKLPRRYLLIIGFLLFLVILGFWDDVQNFYYGSIVDSWEWNQINTRVVELNCAQQAKKVAIEEGYDQNVVLGCSCIALEADLLKTYDCNVDTIDITQAKKVLIHCSKSANDCTIASEWGFNTYSFEKLNEITRIS